MRSDAKAATAGSKQRRMGRGPALLLVSAAACLAALVVVVGPASGATTRFLVEVFGSAAQPTFPGDRGMAVDQGSGELYVLESETDEIRRYNADGTPSNFAALATNVIDGEGSGDETPDVGLAFPFSRAESQIAIDESGGATDGNVYVTESSRDQVSIFDSEGNYLGELSEHSGGPFNEPLGVAVDPSGNVYVGDFSAEDLIHKYEPAANPPVNADHVAAFNSLAGTSSPGTLAAGAGASAGFIFVNRFNGEMFKLDSTTGELKYQVTTGAATSYVDPSTGHVFAVKGFFESSSVDEYDASGAGSATLVSSFKPGSTVEGVAVNGAAEEVYVSRSGTENVEVFGPAAVIPDVVTQAPTSNTGTRATLAGTVNPDGVELDECFFQWGRPTFQGGEGILENTTPCAETPAEIGSGTTPVPVHADLTGLVPQGTTYQFRLVAANPNSSVNGSTLQFSTPNTVLTTAPSGVTSTEATLNGTVNPDTATISECAFEWGPPKAQGEVFQKYPETAPCVPGPGAITGESPVAVSADISELHPGTTYHYRLKATYPTGPIFGSDATVQTAGPVIKGVWSQDVVFTEATLKAQIDPEGKATTYRFEYGTDASYGSETPELSVGSDSSVHEVTRFLTGLQPGTTYHYRVVATNADAANEGPDQTFTTYERIRPKTDCPNQENRYGPGTNLTDCRAYEMVSPIDKNGRGILARAAAAASSPIFNTRAAYDKASLDGDKITYSSVTPFGDVLGGRGSNQYLSSRGDRGWSTHGISALSGEFVTAFPHLPFELDTQFRGFTDDLSTAFVQDYNKTPLTEDAVEGFGNLYRRDNITDGYDPFLTSTPLVWPQVIAKGEVFAWPGDNDFILFRAASADGSRAFFEVHAQLTPDAIPAYQPRQLYEFSAAGLKLVSVLPNGEPNPNGSNVGHTPSSFATSPGRNASLARAVSADGSRVFWTAVSGEHGRGRIYVRIDGESTVAVSEAVTSRGAIFWDADTEGSKALFSFDPVGFFGADGEELYVFDVDTETATLIAEDVRGVVGASEDLSRIYFVSREVLDAGATAGEENVYLREGGAITLVATVAPDDNSIGTPDIADVIPFERYTRLTPDGRHLAFLSRASLTGYDNSDLVSGEPNIEVFLYEAEQDELICASCNPSGARPKGAPLNRAYWVGPPVATESGRPWAAAWIPSWEHELNASRLLSEDGDRLFFNSFDSLVPEDTNGVQDVYQWEAPGSGTCTTTSREFSEPNKGCISLITTGKNPVYSEFIDASANGSNVFVRTESNIHPNDPGLFDIYNVRELGGFPPPPPPPPPCVGDACQNVPAPPNDPTPASAAFRGHGDPVATQNCRALAKRTVRISRRARKVRRGAKQASSARRAKRLRRRSAALAKRAQRLSASAKRCRRANRRAAR